MKKDYKLIILDFDGTIADTNACIIRTFNQTLQEMGYPTVDEQRISNLIGLPLRQMYADILRTDDTELIDRAFHTVTFSWASALRPSLSFHTWQKRCDSYTGKASV